MKIYSPIENYNNFFKSNSKEVYFLKLFIMKYYKYIEANKNINYRCVKNYC